MKTGTAALFMAPDQPFVLKAYPLTPPEKGQALIEMIASGVCGTDVHIHKGRLGMRTPLIIGHELVGRIAALGEKTDTPLKVGDDVIVNVACPCGACLLCRQGDSANCLNMRVAYVKDPQLPPHLYGGYASHCYAAVQNLIPVPAGLDSKMVSVFACTGSTVLHALRLCRQAGLRTPQTAVVQGLGPMGMFALMALSAMGVPRLFAFTYGLDEARSALAMRCGCTEIVDIKAHAKEAIDKVAAASGGAGADFVIECSGNPDAFRQGLDLLRNRGIYAVPGQYSNAREVPIPAQIITFKALHIVGSSQYDGEDVAEYLRFLKAHPELHEHILSMASVYPLSRVNDAIADARCGKNIKTLLIP